MLNEFISLLRFHQEMKFTLLFSWNCTTELDNKQIYRGWMVVWQNTHNSRTCSTIFPYAFSLVTCFWFVRNCFSNLWMLLFVPSWQSFQAFHLMLLIGSFRSMLVSRTCLWLCTPSSYSGSFFVSAFIALRFDLVQSCVKFCCSLGNLENELLNLHSDEDAFVYLLKYSTATPTGNFGKKTKIYDSLIIYFVS